MAEWGDLERKPWVAYVPTRLERRHAQMRMGGWGMESWRRRNEKLLARGSYVGIDKGNEER